MSMSAKPTSSSGSSKYTVSAIPPFSSNSSGSGKGNWANAVKKQSATPETTPSNSENPPTKGTKQVSTPPAAGYSKRESVNIDSISVPPSRVAAIRGASEANVNFGNPDAPLSSSPANPPVFKPNGPPAAFGSVPAQKNKIDVHSFFRSPNAPSTTEDKKDDKAPPAGHQSHLSSSSASFSPRQSQIYPPGHSPNTQIGGFPPAFNPANGPRNPQFNGNNIRSGPNQGNARQYPNGPGGSPQMGAPIPAYGNQWAVPSYQPYPPYYAPPFAYQPQMPPASSGPSPALAARQLPGVAPAAPQSPSPNYSPQPSAPTPGAPFATPPRSGNFHLRSGAAEFTPGGSSTLTPTRKSAAIAIRNPNDHPELAKKSVPNTPVISAPTLKKPEDKKIEEDKEKKKAAEEEKAKVEAEKKAAEEKAKQEAEQKAKEEAEKKAAEEKAKAEEEARLAAEKKAKEDAEQKAKEDAEKKAKDDAEKKAKEDAEQKVKEEEAALVAEQVAEAEAKAKELEAAKVKTEEKRTPTPLDLSATKSAVVSPALPSALATARPITDLSSIVYPPDIKSPSPHLNQNALPGQYRYDREFLLQFMKICIEKPENLPVIDAAGNFGDDPRNRVSRGPKDRGNSAFAGFSQFPGGGNDRFAMGKGLIGGRSMSMGFPGTKPISRASSQGGNSGFNNGGRTSSRRGNPRDDRGNNRGNRPEGVKPGQHIAGQGFEDATLVRIDDAWVPTRLGAEAPPDQEAPEVVQKKVKSLLNKLTLEKFDSISDQILEWGNKSVHESDGRILIQVIALIFEKATDEANWSEMYARLCRKLMDTISDEVRDTTMKNADGVVPHGGILFRKYLLTRCQEDFEAGWSQKVALAQAATKASEEKAKNAEEGGDKTETKEEFTEEYYAAAKAKRRGLGLIRFIGELFRLNMINERIMHNCIKNLMASTDKPDEDDTESLCRLLTTIGAVLDSPKGKQHMDVYFSRLETIAQSPTLSSRIKFMILDVKDLRSKHWKGKQQAGPKLISEIRADAQKEEAQKRASSSGKGLPSLHSQLGGSRQNSRRGHGRAEDFGVPSPSADGWSSTTTRSSKAGDMRNFGKWNTNNTQNSSFGVPNGAFANKGRKESKPTPSTANAFALLSEETEHAESAQVSERPKLNLTKRTVALNAEEDDEEPKSDAAAEDPETQTVEKPAMLRAEAERIAKNNIEEYFNVKNLSEACESVKVFPEEHHQLLIAKFIAVSLEKKLEHIQLVKTLIAELQSKDITSHATIMAAFTESAKSLIDVSVDVPNAYVFFATLLVGGSVTKDELDSVTKEMTSEDEDDEGIEFCRSKLVKEWEKLQA